MWPFNTQIWSFQFDVWAYFLPFCGIGLKRWNNVIKLTGFFLLQNPKITFWLLQFIFLGGTDWSIPISHWTGLVIIWLHTIVLTQHKFIGTVIWMLLKNGQYQLPRWTNRWVTGFPRWPLGSGSVCSSNPTPGSSGTTTNILKSSLILFLLCRLIFLSNWRICYFCVPLIFLLFSTAASLYWRVKGNALEVFGKLFLSLRKTMLKHDWNKTIISATKVKW